MRETEWLAWLCCDLCEGNDNELANGLTVLLLTILATSSRALIGTRDRHWPKRR